MNFLWFNSFSLLLTFLLPFFTDANLKFLWTKYFYFFLFTYTLIKVHYTRFARSLPDFNEHRVFIRFAKMSLNAPF